MRKVVVCGAGGFIGSWLVKRLKSEGHWVRGVDIKLPEFEETQADEFLLRDLRSLDACYAASENVDDVYQLAASMGGIGFITKYLAMIARDNVLINANMLEANRVGKRRYLYTSSACVYNQSKQTDAHVTALREEDAYPAMPEAGYGWEKLFSEQMTEYYAKDYGLDVRIVRFHNVYGPLGTWKGGKEKSPAAICRKVAMAKDGDDIQIWGDGQQTRSYMFIEDCIEGLRRIMESGYQKPLNLGTSQLVTVDEQVDITCHIAGKKLNKVHDLTKPQGVRGRNSCNDRIKEVLGWEPTIRLEDGLAPTYLWIAQQVSKS